MVEFIVTVKVHKKGLNIIFLTNVQNVNTFPESFIVMSMSTVRLLI